MLKIHEFVRLLVILQDVLLLGYHKSFHSVVKLSRRLYNVQRSALWLRVSSAINAHCSWWWELLKALASSKRSFSLFISQDSKYMCAHIPTPTLPYRLSKLCLAACVTDTYPLQTSTREQPVCVNPLSIWACHKSFVTKLQPQGRREPNMSLLKSRYKQLNCQQSNIPISNT